MGKHKREREHSESDSGERRKDKKDKKHKKEKHKKEKRDRDRDPEKDEQKRLVKEAKKYLKQHLKGDDKKDEKAAPPPPPVVPYTGAITPIASDEYFTRNAEFSAWLRDTQGKFFTELGSEESHALFDAFVAAWNGGALASKFYTGAAALATQRTGHAWAFKGGAAPAVRGSLGLAGAMADDMDVREAEREAAGERAKTQRRRDRERDAEGVEEMLGGKATGREAVLEKKAAAREAARARDASPDVTRVTGGGDIMGGGDSFAAAKARESRRDEWRARAAAVKTEALQHRVAASQAVEDAKMAQFRALLAAKGGQMAIAKRT